MKWKDATLPYRSLIFCDILWYSVIFCDILKYSLKISKESKALTQWNWKKPHQYAKHENRIRSTECHRMPWNYELWINTVEYRILWIMMNYESICCILLLSVFDSSTEHVVSNGLQARPHSVSATRQLAMSSFSQDPMAASKQKQLNDGREKGRKTSETAGRRWKIIQFHTTKHYSRWNQCKSLQIKLADLWLWKCIHPALKAMNAISCYFILFQNILYNFTQYPTQPGIPGSIAVQKRAPIISDDLLKWQASRSRTSHPLAKAVPIHQNP